MHPLGPKARNGHRNLNPLLLEVRIVAGVFCKVAQGQHHRTVPVDLFERDFPFVVALLPVHGHHGIERCPILEAQLLGIFNGLAQLVEAVPQQLFRHMRWMCGQEKGQTVRFGVPIRGATVFLTSEAFGANIETSVVPTVGLVQVEDVEADGLLSLHIAFDLDVSQRPNVLPSLSVGASFGFVPCRSASFCLTQGLFRTSPCIHVQGADEAHEFGDGHRVRPVV